MCSSRDPNDKARTRYGSVSSRRHSFVPKIQWTRNYHKCRMRFERLRWRRNGTVFSAESRVWPDNRSVSLGTSVYRCRYKSKRMQMNIHTYTSKLSKQRDSIKKKRKEKKGTTFTAPNQANKAIFPFEFLKSVLFECLAPVWLFVTNFFQR